MVLKDTAFEPMAEFKKFTASLLTPTIKSAIANTAKAMIIIKYMLSINIEKFQEQISRFKFVAMLRKGYDIFLI